MKFFNKKQEEKKQPISSNELNEDTLMNIAGGMQFSPEEAERNIKFVKDIVKLPK